MLFEVWGRRGRMFARLTAGCLGHCSGCWWRCWCTSFGCFSLSGAYAVVFCFVFWLGRGLQKHRLLLPCHAAVVTTCNYCSFFSYLSGSRYGKLKHEAIKLKPQPLEVPVRHLSISAAQCVCFRRIKRQAKAVAELETPFDPWLCHFAARMCTAESRSICCNQERNLREAG